MIRRIAGIVVASAGLLAIGSTSIEAGTIEPIEFSGIGVPYGWGVVMDDNAVVETPADHVGAWSWDEDNFPETARGWTHTSKWVKLDLQKPAQLTLKLENREGVPWPSAEDANRLAGTNLFPSFTLYRGWDTDAGLIKLPDGTTLDQDHTFNNRGNIEWAEDVTYLDHLDNGTVHSVSRTWILPAGQYTINLGGNSPAALAEGRQGYKATFSTTPSTVNVSHGALSAIDFNAVGIPYGWGVVMDDNAVVETPADHVGAWSWDEDNFPETARGWTHTSKWVKLDLQKPAQLTLKLENREGVPWPSAEDANRLAGTNLFPSFSLYRGWDTDAGLIKLPDGTTLDQDHTFNNRGNIEWAEDVTYLDHLDNGTVHSVSRTWILPAGQYTINLGGNSPAALAEGRQGYKATFSTTPSTANVSHGALSAIDFNAVGIPYGWGVVMDDNAVVETPADHVGAWSWDEDNFPETARGWTHTSKWVKLDLQKPAQLTLKLENREGVPWPSAEDANRLAGTNLFPSFTLYRGWDTDAGLIKLPDGTTLDQDHTFNNRGNIEWAEDVTYLDHLDNGTVHSVSRTWILPAGQYTINLGGNSPAALAEGRQGYKATFSTTPSTVNVSHGALSAIDFNAVGIPYGWGVVMDDNAVVETPADHVGAWSWDEDNFPETARGWTHTSKWVKLDLQKPAQLTLKLENREGVPWPSAEDANRLAGTNLFPSFSLYRGWDTDAGLIKLPDGTTLDQDHTFNNRGNIEWAEDVTYLDHLDNGTVHSVSRTWILPAGQYTINLGGNSPAALAEGRQGYKATFSTTPSTVTVSHGALSAIDFNAVGIPYGWGVVMDDNAVVETPADHVGAWSWDEDNFPETARGWTHTSKWVKLDLQKPAQLTLKLENREGVPWPSAEDANRLAGTNLFPSFTLYRGWDTDAGLIKLPDGTTLDQDHTFNNRGNIEWAEDVTYLDHLDNGTVHSVSRTWILPAGQYTINLGGNSPAALAEGRQGYKATFSTTPSTVNVSHGALSAIDFNAVGIPYGWGVVMDDNAMVETPADHVGAWSWDEDNFPETARGWTHTSKWVKLDLQKPAQLTLKLENREGVPWPSAEDANRLAGTNLFPSFTLYRGWDTDAGLIKLPDGTTLDQDHTFNNRGNIEWAEDVTYLDHLDNGTVHSVSRTWILPAGQYTINLGGNSPAALAEGRQGYKATFSTTPSTVNVSHGALSAIDFNAVGIPYGWGVVMDDNAVVETPADHVGAWSWDEDNFPETARGWTHTSKWVKLDLQKPAQLTLKLENREGVPWPSAEDANRLAGTNLFPSFSLYRGWDTDAGLIKLPDGTTLDQDHTFNNRGNIEWAEDVTYLDHLDNGTVHSVSRTWILPAGQYTINLGGNSPAALAEGRQGYKATFSTTPSTVNVSHGALSAIDFNAVGIPYGWGVVMDDNAVVETPADHVGAWSWDEDNFPETARGWTHTSKWVKLDLQKPAQLTLKLENREGVPWPSAEDANRLAGTNLFPSFSLYRGWDTDAGLIKLPDGTTLDQDHTFNNRGNIEWAEDVTYLDHLDNGTVHSVSRTWILPAGQYTINLGGNSPAALAEGRQGYKATFSTTPSTVNVSHGALSAIDFNAVGIPYGWGVVMDDNAVVETPADHVGAWSWDEDNFPETARGWTHTSKWVKLDLQKPAQLTLKLENREGVPWPSAEDANRLAGTNLFPSFTLYRGWDTDAGLIKLPDGTTLDQDHTFNNRGNIEWAEDVTYLDHLDNGTVHSVSRTWILPAGQYTINLGGNSPAALAEGRQGYKATFSSVEIADQGIAIQRVTEGIRLRWPSEFLGWKLQTAGDLNGGWEASEATPVRSSDGSYWEVILTQGDGAKYFRLGN